MNKAKEVIHAKQKNTEYDIAMKVLQGVLQWRFIIAQTVRLLSVEASQLEEGMELTCFSTFSNATGIDNGHAKKISGCEYSALVHGTSWHMRTLHLYLYMTASGTAT